MDNCPLISVIVPVYNVEEYLNDCISSIVSQTYENIELILVDDGSTDQSGTICKEWCERDSRIVLLTQKNLGQAVARNNAVECAKGELITFVDSDDWIDSSMIQKLYESLEKYNSDISMCEAYTENSEGKMSSYSLQRLDKELINIQDDKEFLLSVRYTFWSKLYKKKLFTDNKIIQPQMKYEDFSIVPLLYALAEKVSCVDEALYYYRYRPTSTVRNVSYIDDRLKALQVLIDGFRTHSLGDEWECVLKRLCIERGMILMRQVYPILSNRFKIFCNDYDKLLKRNYNISLSEVSKGFYSQCKNGRISERLLGEYNLAVFGSYNLMIAAKIVMNLGMPDYLDLHESFSSLISVTSDADEDFYDWDISHSNAFREKHLIQDITKTFMHYSPSRFKDVDFFLVDFLEERYDVAFYKGCYFTLSDAYADIKDRLDIPYARIPKRSNASVKLWENSCLKFIERLRKYIDPSRVILVKSFLCERFGDDTSQKEYENINEIREINTLLDHYYGFFSRHMPEAVVIDMSNIDMVTDKDFKHGCYPWHISQDAYWKLSTKINNAIKRFEHTDLENRLSLNYNRFWNHKNSIEDNIDGFEDVKELYSFDEHLVGKRVIFYGEDTLCRIWYKEFVLPGKIELMGVYRDAFFTQSIIGQEPIAGFLSGNPSISSWKKGDEIEGLMHQLSYEEFVSADKSTPIFVATKNKHICGKAISKLQELGFKNIYTNLWSPTSNFDVGLEEKWIKAASVEINQALELFDESLSKLTLSNLLQYRINNESELVNSVCSYGNDMYFPRDIFSSDENVIIDAGFDNYTFVMQMKQFCENNCKRIYVFTVSDYEVGRLKECGESNIQIVNSELYSASGSIEKLVWENCEDTSRMLTQNIPVIKLDEYMSEINDKVSYIRIDSRTSSIEMLNGALETIKKYKPKLAIRLDKRFADLWEVPIWIARYLEGYKLFLRHYSTSGKNTILYAVYDDR